MKDKFKEIRLTSLLKRIKEIFDRHEITYWLDAGTLLKTVRDSNIIPCGDIDFGTWQSEIDKVLLACEEFNNDGFNIRYQGSLPFVEDAIRVQIPEKYKDIISGLAFDIYLYGKLNNEAVRRNINRPVQKMGKFLLTVYRELNTGSKSEWVSERHRKFLKVLEITPTNLRESFSNAVLHLYINACISLWYVFPSIYFENLSPIRLYGLEFKMPTDIEGYLKYRYGEGWRIPNRSYRLTEGEFLRFRRLREMNAGKRIFRKVHSYRISPSRENEKTGIFELTKTEIRKIKSFE